VTILNEVGSVFADLADRRLGSSAEPATGAEGQVPQITVSTFDPAHLEPGTIEASAGSTIAIATLLGLALGLVLAFVRDALDDRIRSPRDAEEAFRAPVIGAIPKGLRGTRITSPSKLVADLPRDVMESLYLLRANLQFSQVGTSGPVLVLTSAVPKEGKSLVGASLAVTLALAGSRVICVEADVRRPELHAFLGIEPRERGLADALEHDVSVESFLVDVPLNPADAALAANGGLSGRWRMSAKPDVELDVDTLGGRSLWGRSGRSTTVPPLDMSLVGSLQLLPAGNVTSNPANLLTRTRAERFVEELRARADVVIFDTPPVLGVGDAFPLMSLADMVLVVARYGEISRATAEAVQATLMRLGVRKVSVVLNEAPSGTIGHGVGPAVPEQTPAGAAAR
jgi:Mrp family chromosome partitioning ATPase